MQRDFFDDEQRDTIGSEEKTSDDRARGQEQAQRAQAERARAQREAQRAKAAQPHGDQARVQGHQNREDAPHMGQAAAPVAAPRPNVIDAEIVEEVSAARPHAAAAEPKSGHERLVLFAFVAVLLGGIVLLQGQTKALQATSFAEAPTLNVPVIVRYADVQKPILTNDQQMQVSFKEIVDNASALRKSVEHLSRPAVSTGSKPLTEAEYAALKQYLADKEGITNENDVRDVLLQAGYTLPARLPDEDQPTKHKRNGQDHVAFAKHVISRLLKDEVEDFLEKIQIVSEVGVYVAETAEDQ